MLKLYDYAASGNCYKVRLALNQLEIPFESRPIDVCADSRPSEFLAKHPMGKVPLLELEGGQCMSESNAILAYLCEGTPLAPRERLERARTLAWMFFEQNRHEPYIATSRYWLSIAASSDEVAEQLARWQHLGLQALGIMEQHLAHSDFFVAERYTMADIALYAYTHVAAEGGFELGPFTAIERWMERVRQQPGHVPMLQGSLS